MKSDLRLNGIRMREEYEAKMAHQEDAGLGGVGAHCKGAVSGGGFDVTVEGVAISGPLETPGEIRAAMEHDWRSADIGGEGEGSGVRKTRERLISLQMDTFFRVLNAALYLPKAT